MSNHEIFSQRGAGLVVAPIGARMRAFGEYEIDGTASSMKARDFKDATDLVLQPVAHTLRTEGHDASEDGSGRGVPLVPVSFAHQAGGDQTTLGFDPSSGTAGTLTAHQTHAVAFDLRGRDGGAMPEGPHDTANMRAASGGSSRSYVAQAETVAFAENSRAELRLCGGDRRVAAQLTCGGGKPGQGQPVIASSWAVRRLTPLECERLQGFPDGYTQVPRRGKPSADGPRYKDLGNSMAVNAMEYIGRRIDLVRHLIETAKEVANA